MFYVYILSQIKIKIRIVKFINLYTNIVICNLNNKKFNLSLMNIKKNDTIKQFRSSNMKCFYKPGHIIIIILYILNTKHIIIAVKEYDVK